MTTFTQHAFENSPHGALPYPNLMFCLLVSALAAPVLAYIYLPFSTLSILTGVVTIWTCVLGLGNAIINPNACDTPEWWRDYRYYFIGWFGFFAVALFALANLAYAFKVV